MAKSSVKDTTLPPSHPVEWSVPIDVDKVSSTPLPLSISPSDSERSAVARRLGVTEVNDLKAEIVLVNMIGSHLIQVNGTLSATITQSCVVTLQPIETHIRDEFETWFADAAQAIPYARAKQDVQRKASGQEIEILNEKDDPESIVNGKIDIGELVVQYLSLSIDPYPHAPEVDDDRPETISAGTEISPFAALAALRPKNGSSE
ncbi:MAG: DUF177 domain-containing protein [Pseudomonadota bacterium]